jgi:predicted 3-demethylubiquinone-9 3-methyltransferase (glyoxalase superfamily)
MPSVQWTFTTYSSPVSRRTNDAISLFVSCDSQAEIDHYWNALLENGGKPQGCGWIVDRYGVRWQIVPSMLREMIAAPDRAAARRAVEVMLKQVKLDVGALEAAFAGR